MVKAPSWWFNATDLKSKFTRTVTATKRGEHTRFFIKDVGRVSESKFNQQYGGDLYRNQVRGFARRMGITDWNKAQSQFSNVRKEHIKNLKDAEALKRKQTGKKDDTLSREEQQDIWDKYAYVKE